MQVCLERVALLAMMVRAGALHQHSYTGAPCAALLQVCAEASRPVPLSMPPQQHQCAHEPVT